MVGPKTPRLPDSASGFSDCGDLPGIVVDTETGDSCIIHTESAKLNGLASRGFGHECERAAGEELSTQNVGSGVGGSPSFSIGTTAVAWRALIVRVRAADQRTRLSDPSRLVSVLVAFAQTSYPAA
jgi:hypothetical protein